ncbi:MAG: hypothetical protein LKF44_08180 [Atopobiaceae bacterium]|jgi:hypothetical protein|nr:hypothetical protein [Atopobiaceae bacterium]
MDGTYVSRRLIDDALGESVCDEHGRRVMSKHIGEAVGDGSEELSKFLSDHK